MAAPAQKVTTADAFKAVQARLQTAQAADAKAKQDLAVAEARLRETKEEIEAKLGKGMADVKKLEAAAGKARQEADSTIAEMSKILSEHGYE